MNLPLVFLGPTLSEDKARNIIDAEFRPPAKKGDFIKLAMSSEDRLIVLIDGVFLQDYPPSPIEVYQVLKKNFKVYGASSLGALRAVELEKFGMHGYGKIFELYKKNIINSDDEVAVTFDTNYNLLSEAMIDIRFNLFLLFKNGIIDKETKQILAKVAKKIYFPFRTYENIFNQALITYPNKKDFIERFHRYVLKNRTSLKENDAIRLLKHVSKHSNNTV